MPNYPEHEKLSKIKDQSQAIGEFIDWLRQDQEYVIAKYHECDEDCPDRRSGGRGGCCRDDELDPYFGSDIVLLARYFDIDLGKLEDEKLEMLKEIRSC